MCIARMWVAKKYGHDIPLTIRPETPKFSSDFRTAVSLPSARVGGVILLGFLFSSLAFGFWTGCFTVIAAVFILAVVHSYDLNGEENGLHFHDLSDEGNGHRQIPSDGGTMFKV